MTYDVIIVGGGAAGFFAAINIAEQKPNASVLILEKTSKLLSKVEISGGGRCNVTNACYDNKELVNNYPRGSKELLSCFYKFNPNNTISWFESRGVSLAAESDNRIFPISNNSRTIIDCFFNEVDKFGIEISTKTKVEKIASNKDGFLLYLDENDKVKCKNLLIATGGHTKVESFSYLNSIPHEIEKPIPSLFTFNLENKNICNLQGLAIKDVIVRLPEFKHSFRDSVLITHWGLSGPAVLKLSAFAAKELYNNGYKYTIEVNWLPELKQEDIFLKLKQNKSSKSNLHKKIFSEIPQRLWDYFLMTANIDSNQKWADSSNTKLEELSYLLNKSNFEAKGKTTFKEEFVTCGGISRKEIDFRTMKSKKVDNLFFAGEVIDIDGITGGFNFQAAWTTGFIAAESITQNL